MTFEFFVVVGKTCVIFSAVYPVYVNANAGAGRNQEGVPDLL